MSDYKDRDEKIKDFIFANEIATREEVELVCSVAGTSEKNLNLIIYARTGYHDVEQLLDCEQKNYIDMYGDFTEEETDEEEACDE